MEDRNRNERGVVMFVTVLLLALMGALGLAALDAASRDRDSAGYYSRETAAFYAAEAGVAHARAIVRGVGSVDELPNFPTQGSPQNIVGYTGGGGVVTPTAPPATYYGDPLSLKTGSSPLGIGPPHSCLHVASV